MTTPNTPSTQTLTLDTIRLAVARSYLDYAYAICHRIADNPTSPLPAAQLRILREAAARRDDPGGGGTPLLNLIIATLVHRTVAIAEHNKQNPDSITITRTEVRALNFLESLAIERDVAAGLPIPLTPREQRQAKLRQAQDLSRSEARIERALDREALRESERDEIEELRARPRPQQKPAASASAS
jgi:hypothetical protein